MDGHCLRYGIDPPVDLHGLSGAPVVDRGGHVAGVIALWFQPRKAGGTFLEAGGEDAAAIYLSVER